MIYKYYCVDCARRLIGDAELTVDEHNELIEYLSINVKHGLSDRPGVICPVCDGGNMQRVLSVATAYVKGYGFLDKQGVKNDMDINAMVTGSDPYAQHRQVGENRELIKRLQRRRERNSRPRNVHV